MGDGCNMEGISNEAASLAGHWGLGKLIALYDDNRISIDGHTDISFTEDVSARYEALGWHVQHVADGNHDLEGLHAAIAKAKSVTDKPSLIKVSTLIGYGSPNKADSHDVHGAPLGASETAATRENLKWPYGEFEVPQEAYDEFAVTGKRGAELHAAWEKTRAAYAAKYPEEYAEFASITSGEPASPAGAGREGRPAAGSARVGRSSCPLLSAAALLTALACCESLEVEGWVQSRRRHACTPTALPLSPSTPQASSPTAGRSPCPSSPRPTAASPRACTARRCSTRWLRPSRASSVALPTWRPPT